MFLLRILAVVIVIHMIIKTISKIAIVNYKTDNARADEHDYINSLPDKEVSPAQVAGLLKMGRRSSDVFIAIIASLTEKQYISIILNDPEADDTIFILNDAGDEKITADEEVVLKYLKNINGGNPVTVDGLKTYIEMNKEKWRGLNSKVKKIATKENYEKNYLTRVKNDNFTLGDVAYYVIAFFVGFFAFINEYPISLYVYFIVFLIAVALDGIVFCKKENRTLQGLKMAKKWRGFIPYIDEYSGVGAEDEIDSDLLEKYLVYSIILGCEWSLVKKMHKFDVEGRALEMDVDGIINFFVKVNDERCLYNKLRSILEDM